MCALCDLCTKSNASNGSSQQHCTVTHTCTNSCTKVAHVELIVSAACLQQQTNVGVHVKCNMSFPKGGQATTFSGITATAHNEFSWVARLTHVKHATLVDHNIDIILKTHQIVIPMVRNKCRLHQNFPCQCTSTKKKTNKTNPAQTTTHQTVAHKVRSTAVQRRFCSAQNLITTTLTFMLPLKSFILTNTHSFLYTPKGFWSTLS